MTEPDDEGGRLLDPLVIAFSRGGNYAQNNWPRPPGGMSIDVHLLLCGNLNVMRRVQMRRSLVLTNALLLVLCLSSDGRSAIETEIDPDLGLTFSAIGTSLLTDELHGIPANGQTIELIVRVSGNNAIRVGNDFRMWFHTYWPGGEELVESHVLATEMFLADENGLAIVYGTLAAGETTPSNVIDPSFLDQAEYETYFRSGDFPDGLLVFHEIHINLEMPLADATSLATAGLGFHGFEGGEQIFTVVASATVPEPASLIIWSLLGFVGTGVAWRRSRRASIA